MAKRIYKDDCLEVFQVRALKDNLVYMLVFQGKAICIDASDGEAIREFLAEKQLKLEVIAVTHCDYDHTQGLKELKDLDAAVLGPSCLDKYVTQEVQDDEELIVEQFEVATIGCSGHSGNDMMYHFLGAKILFTGDIVFGAGCGRARDEEGAADDIFDAFERVKQLDDQTIICGGHDYLVKNLEFALTLLPENPEVQARLNKARDADGAICATLSEEKGTNVFMMPENEDIKRKLGLEINAEPRAVFKALLSEKQQFNKSYKEKAESVEEEN
ncbi:MAG: Hydroxyacylglutathione hydrolase GloB [Chlamydiia bacterium]|nr:Hydroxyacylglutathione hydrolase GloB [Chlamydiia bacterium]